MTRQEFCIAMNSIILQERKVFVDRYLKLMVQARFSHYWRIVKLSFKSHRTEPAGLGRVERVLTPKLVVIGRNRCDVI